jgi:hypothetical protein
MYIDGEGINIEFCLRMFRSWMHLVIMVVVIVIVVVVVIITTTIIIVIVVVVVVIVIHDRSNFLSFAFINFGCAGVCSLS